MTAPDSGVRRSMYPRAFATALALAALPTGAAAQFCSQCSVTANSSPPLLRVTTAVAGAPPTEVVSATTSLATVADSGNRVIKARLNAAPPPGVVLEAKLGPVVVLGFTFGASAGYVALTTSAQTLISALPSGNYSVPVTWRVRAASAAGVAALSSRTATFTIELR